jgi:hypothetical protein
MRKSSLVIDRFALCVISRRVRQLQQDFASRRTRNFRGSNAIDQTGFTGISVRVLSLMRGKLSQMRARRVFQSWIDAQGETPRRHIGFQSLG